MQWCKNKKRNTILESANNYWAIINNKINSNFNKIMMKSKNMDLEKFNVIWEIYLVHLLFNNKIAFNNNKCSSSLYNKFLKMWWWIIIILIWDNKMYLGSQIAITAIAIVWDFLIINRILAVLSHLKTAWIISKIWIIVNKTILITRKHFLIITIIIAIIINNLKILWWVMKIVATTTIIILIIIILTLNSALANKILIVIVNNFQNFFEKLNWILKIYFIL